MATDTTTIEDQLRALVRLQIIDTKIDQLTKLRGDLPDEIRDLEDERAGLQTRLTKIDQDKKEAEVQKKKLKLRRRKKRRPRKPKPRKKKTSQRTA